MKQAPILPPKFVSSLIVLPGQGSEWRKGSERKRSERFQGLEVERASLNT